MANRACATDRNQLEAHVVFQTGVLISGRSHTASHNLSTGVAVNHPDVDAISKSADFGRLPGQIQVRQIKSSL